MSDLAERIAREHAVIRLDEYFVFCRCGQEFLDLDPYTAHLAQVAEAAVREQVAREIEVDMRRHDRAQVGFSAVGDAYTHAARIVRGEA